MAQPLEAPQLGSATDWASTAASLPADLPGKAYDAIREKYFYQNLAPTVLQRGSSLSEAQAHFMQSTERPKTENPKLDAFATAAGQALSAPISAMNPMWEAKELQDKIDAKASEAGKEALRQNINPAPLQFAGQAIGMAPYFAEGMMGPEAAVASLEKGLFTKTIRASTVGLIQGAYDGVTAPEGEKGAAAIKGFILGAGTEGTLEGVGSMWGYLRGAHNLSPQEAKAVEAVAKGVATPKDVAKATSAGLSTGDLDKSVETYPVVEKAKRAKQGQPKDAPVDPVLPTKEKAPPSDRVRINMIGADGKPYVLGGNAGMRVNDIDKISSRVVEHLNNGGEIQSVSGDPKLIQATLKQLADKNPTAFSLDIPIKPKSNSSTPAKPATIKCATPATTSSSEYQPAPMVRGWLKDEMSKGNNPSTYDIQSKFQMNQEAASRVMDWWDEAKDVRSSVHDVINSRNTVYHATSVEGFHGILDSEEINVGDRVPDSQYSTFADHVESDTVDNWKANNLGVSVSRVPRVSSKADKAITFVIDQSKMPSSRPFAESGYEKSVAPSYSKSLALLKEHFPEEYDLYWKASVSASKLPRVKAAMKAVQDMIGSDRNESFEFENRTYNEPIPLHAVKGAIIDKSALADEFGSAADVVAPKEHAALKAAQENPYLSEEDLEPFYKAIDEKMEAASQNSLIDSLTSRLKTKGIPYKIMENGKEVHSYRAGLAKQPPSMRWAVEMKDVPQYDKLSQLPSGEILNEETGEVFDSIQEAQAPPKLTSKETPYSRRFTGDSGFTPAEGDTLGVTVQIPGQPKPYIFYRDANPDRATIFHENLHGHFGALDMHNDVMDIMDHPTTEQLFQGAFTPETKEVYAGPESYREEVYVHGADAIRTNDTEKIDAFIEADTDKATYLNWMAERTNALKARVAEAPDSLHKRALERKLNAVEARATRSIGDVNHIYSQAPVELDYAHGDYAVREGESAKLFGEREDALQEMEQWEEPLNTPELVDMSRLPEGLPRYSKAKPMKSGEKPNVTTPPSPEIRQARGGIQLASRMFRPFNDWIATVAQRNEWPEVFQAFAPMDQAQVQYNNLVRPHIATIRDTVANASEARQADYYRWFADQGDKDLHEKMMLTPEELEDLARLKRETLDPLERELGFSLEDYVAKTGSKKNFMSARVLAGSLDPEEKNFTKLVAKYLEFGAFDKYVDPVLENAQKVINEQMPDTLPGAAYKGRYNDLRAGNLYPLLQRHIDHQRGMPDFTQQIIKGALEDTLGLINKGLAKVNSVAGTSFEPFDKLSDDPLRKFTLFSYAGALALKPSTVIRDALQIMLTTFPIAGRYTFVGMQKAFPAFKGGEEAAHLWDIPQKYGALIERNDLRSLYTSDITEGAKEGAAEKIANWGMRSIQFTHNSNRLAAFWGHSEQLLDALTNFRTHGDPAKFTRESGLWFMSPSMRESFLKEVPTLNATNRADFSYRAAKELVELSQWNFKRGANPGLYEYQLGRLFGQYGTWPLNYIEYARRLATAGDGKAIQGALTNLALAHGAVLAAGQGLGVDTGRWIFTGPMAFSGGPIFEAMTNLPTAVTMDPEGADARTKVMNAVPGVQRALGAKDVFMDVIGDKPDMWPNLLGFHVMHSGDYNQGLHKYLPGKEE